MKFTPVAANETGQKDKSSETAATEQHRVANTTKKKARAAPMLVALRIADFPVSSFQPRCIGNRPRHSYLHSAFDIARALPVALAIGHSHASLYALSHSITSSGLQESNPTLREASHYWGLGKKSVCQQGVCQLRGFMATRAKSVPLIAGDWLLQTERNEKYKRRRPFAIGANTPRHGSGRCSQPLNSSAKLGV